MARSNYFDPHLAKFFPNRGGWHLEALWSALPIIVIPVFIILSICLGWVAPTETGAVAATNVLALGLIRDRLDVSKILRAGRSAALTSALLLLIFGSGSVFARYNAPCFSFRGISRPGRRHDDSLWFSYGTGG